MNLQQNTLYLLTPGTFVNRDHLTLQIEVPVYQPELEPEKRSRRSSRDRINCLLSFLYALVRHDGVAALTS